MGRWMVVAVLFGCMVVGSSLWGLPAVEAHAVLDRSIPSAGSELLIVPSQIEMWFTEPIEPAYSGARLLDTTGTEISTPPTITDPNDPYRLTLPLPTLAPGVYTVAWHNLSSADGHQWQGAFAFTVLNPNGTRPDGTPAALDDIPADGTLRPALVLARWLQLVGASLLFGLPFFRLVLERGEGVIPERRFRWYGIAALVASTAGILLYVAFQLNTLGGWQLLPNFLTNSTAGRLVLLRLALLATLTILLFLRLGQPRLRFSLALGGAGILWLTYSLGSHAAAAPSGSAWAIMVDALHGLSAAVWVGGLWFLPAVLGEWRTNSAATEQKARLGIIRRFSTTALVVVVVLAVTGVFSSLVHIPTLAALLNTRYGQTLLVKLGITLLALLLAWRNRETLHQQIGRLYQPTEHRRFWLQMVIEGSVVVLLMASVAMLVQTNLPPAAEDESGYVESIVPSDDLQVHLQISPNQVGFNRFLVHLYHEDSSPIGEVQAVRLIFNYQGAELGSTTAEMISVNSSIFELEGSYYSQPGDWLLSVYVRRRGMDDVLVNIPFQVASATPDTTLWGNPIPTLPGVVVVGGIVLLVGAVLVATGRTQPLERWQRPTTYAGLVLVVVGLGVALGGTWLLDPATPTNEPPDTLESIAMGGELYTTHCMACHGVNGLGDGSQSTTVAVPPANLIEHVPAHTNRGLFQFIQFGFPDSGMPPFGDTLPDSDIWALVHYLRAEFGQGIAPP